MLSESEVREWRDKEKERVSAIHNPYHKKRASDTLLVLNAILQEE